MINKTLFVLAQTRRPMAISELMRETRRLESHVHSDIKCAGSEVVQVGNNMFQARNSYLNGKWKM